jgi:4a-hydroxytetrahydrobiopterin dehydratase
MTSLAQETCKPSQGQQDALKGEELHKLASQVEGWDVVEEHHIEKHFEFDDFKNALAFVNSVGRVAEEQGHHPDICFTYGQADIKIFTHSVDGLSRADFVLAAKIDELQ